jgi:predicted aspartyl protease
MAAFVYPFYKISNELFRPWIPITIINPKNNAHISIMALLDTGADHCVFPKFLADQLGIDLKGAALETEVMQGLGENKIEVWKHPFRIELRSPDRKQIVWKGKETIVGCVEHDNIPPILGFSNFMANFKITFNHATKKILIDDHPKV